MQTPPVLAIVVAHNGARWLEAVLASLAGQTYGSIEVIGVDNASTDGSREILLAALGEERVLVTDADLGFARAVSLALDSSLAAASDAELLLFLHDDLVLEPDAVEHLVTEVARDPRVAIVGPKHVFLGTTDVLQDVGMSIDLTGRADSGLDPDERDQGQHDRIRPTLYVTTAGMLVRRGVFEELGRFDPRYGLFRDDLDLCWRAWLRGHDVEVVPAAVSQHVAASAEYRRDGAMAGRGARYLAERNTLATLLKCYRAPRLLLILPLFLLLGVAKVAGFIVTRRVTDAWDTVRAWGWNLRQLPMTRRMRHQVQDSRMRSDGELRPLFARTVPRTRAYLEAIAEQVLGPEAEYHDRNEGDTRPSLFARRPALLGASVIVLLALVAVIPLLSAGDLRGGDLAAWPASSAEFLRSYAAPRADVGGLWVGQPASPAQVVLGVVGFVAVGSAWLAGRLVLLGALPLAWFAALRASTVLVDRPAPRIAAATLYAVSPPAVAAVLTGRIGGIVFLVVLPLLVLAGRHASSVHGPRDRAWRATAAAALLVAVMVAFEPPLAFAAVLAISVGVIAVSGVDAPSAPRIDAGLRIVLVGLGALVLLLPWSISLLRSGSPLIGGFGDTGAAFAAFGRWALFAPDLAGFPGMVAGAALPAAAIIGIFLGGRSRPALTATLAMAGVLPIVVAWLLGRAGPGALLWPGHALLVAAAACAGLLALGLAVASEELSGFVFGWRQVFGIGLAAIVAVGVAAGAFHLLGDRFGSLTVGEPALPAFIGADADEERSYRVVVLTAVDEEVRWDLTGGRGPTMLGYGADADTGILNLTESAIAELVARASPTAASRLGQANIRYIYVPEGGRSDELEAALAHQLRIEPQSVEHGLVYEILDWLPRVALLPSTARPALVDLAPLPDATDPRPMDRAEDRSWVGQAAADGVLAIAAPRGSAWEVSVDGTRLGAVEAGALTRYVIPRAGAVTVRASGGERRVAEVVLQAAAALLAISLALRAPRFARRMPWLEEGAS